MITFKEACEVYHERYRLSAPEARQNVKLDFEILDNRENRHHLYTKESFNQYLQEMEDLGSD